MHLYGLLIGLGLVILINKNPQYSPKFWLGLFSSCLIGARLYHVADYWGYYSHHLNEILYTWNGGLGIFGAILAGLLFIILYSFINHKSYFKYLDSVTPWLPLIQSIGRFGNYFNHENPVWWLESLGCFILFIVIKTFPKNPTATYLIGYGLIRFTTEFYRQDTWTISSIHIAQVLSILFIIAGSLLLLWPKNLHLNQLSRS